jgi:hypothetical protein
MRTLLLTLLVSVAAVGFSFAEEAAPNAQAAAPKAVKSAKASKAAKVSKKKALTVKGTVESVGVAANTIKVKAGKGAAEEIMVGNAPITKGDKVIGITDVSVGASVVVDLVQKEGAMKAKSVKVLTAKAPKAKKKAAAK